MSSPFDSSSTECPNRSAVHSLEPARHAHLTQVSRSSSLYCLPYTQTLSNLTTVAHSSYSSRLSSFPFLSSHLPSGQSSPVYRPPHLLSTTTAASVSNPTTRTVRYRLLSLRLRKGHLLVACSAAQRSAVRRISKLSAFSTSSVFSARQPLSPPLSSSLSVSTKGYSLQSLVGHYTLSSYIQYTTTLLSRLILSLTLLSPQARHLSLI